MHTVIQKWYDWLQQACPEPAEVATSAENEELAQVHSDGRQLWATDGHSLHARHVTTGKTGRVTLDEEGLFQVQESGQVPDLTATMPKSEPAGTVVVERDRLLESLAGQDRHVRLVIFAADQALELSSAGAYALVMPVVGLEPEDFWRPGISKD